MVRAGIVKHPAEWAFCGYNEIQNPRQRYSLINYDRLSSLLQMRSIEELQNACRNLIEEEVAKGDKSKKSRDSRWTESIAVGNKKFIEATIERLGIKAMGRRIVGGKSSYEIRDPATPYIANFDAENGHLSAEDSYYWDNIA